MLLHLKDRPLNLQRFPNGAGSTGFWQKDIPDTAPTWLTRWRETGVDGRTDRDANDHLIADRAASLCWLGNQASFEIHAWTGRLPDPWQPTFAYIDIDPGEKTTLEETLVLARLYRTALGHLGVRGYPKTTGKRGIQIWIPIVPKYSFEQTSQWVERVSKAVGSTVPELVSWEWAKGNAAGQGPSRLHPERLDQDAGRAVLGPAGGGRPGLGADHLGRARRQGSATRPLDDPDHRRPRRQAGRPVRRGPDRRPGAPRGLTPGRGPHGRIRTMTDDTIRLRQPDRRRDPSLRPADRRGVRRGVQRSRAGSRAPIVGARSAHRCRRWRQVGRDRRRIFVRADRARRGGRSGRDHHDRRHAESSAARDPSPDHALALRPGSRARRAGLRPVGVRKCDLPALRVRDRDAPEHVRHRAHPDRPSPGRLRRSGGSAWSIAMRRRGSSRRSTRPSASASRGP